ncbi:MAG: hypothetical protein IJT15_01685 [Rickettsiales bacterium]|nr:hypothetical protein [Rickettsiales bacterium]
MGFFSNWFDDKTGIKYFKDFGYNQLHTTTDYDDGMHCANFTVPRSNDERYNAVNSIYNNLFGKDVDTQQVSHLYNKGSGSIPYDGRPVFPDYYGLPKTGDPGAIAYVDVNITQDMADYLNKELAGDNPLRAKINTDSDDRLSTDEIQNYFDKFAVNGKISHFDMENIYALKNNAIIKDALFTKYNDIGGIDTDVKLSYDDIKDKSIISESDFHKLDVVFDGTEDGLISKDVFDKFEFDKNGDHVIDKDEYAEGMQRVDRIFSARSGESMVGDALSKIPKQKDQSYNMETKPCNNSETEEHLAQQSSDIPDIH